jgi:K+-sensing histidine kinase KdpD
MPGPDDGVVPISLLRAVAHEIRQPLSTIESIAYYLRLILPRADPKVREQLARIEQLVEQSNWILTSGLQLAEAVPAPTERVDFEELITQTVAARIASHHPQPQPVLELAGALPLVSLDPSLGRTLIDNLLMLFQPLSSETFPVRLRTSAAESGDVLLEIATAAPGYRSESALGPGSALGIESVRRIAAAQGGSLDMNVNHDTGIQLRLLLRSSRAEA